MTDWPATLRLLPGYDPYRDAGDCTFNERLADRAVEFFHECLTHVEGALAGKPFMLEPWQQAIVGNLFGWLRPDGSRRYREALLYVPRKCGKALSLDTPLPTPTGWTTMGEVKEGDTLFDETGRQCHVLYTADIMHGNECMTVEFSDGETITADADHLWTVRDRMREREVTITTREMAATVSCGNRPTHRERRYSVRVPGPIECPETALPVAPYTLGAWLGDGDSDCARITVGANDMAEMVAALAADGTLTVQQASSGRAPRLRLGPPGRSQASRDASVQSALRTIGLLEQKHIPAVYLRSSPAQRAALLQGLMDTDGCVNTRGNGCEFTTTLPRLRDDFVELARSLGIKTRAREGRATILGRDCGPKYRILFAPPPHFSVFRMSRKGRRCRLNGGGRTRSSTKQVVAITPTRSVPVRCIKVDSPSSLFLAGRGFTPTHNTPLVAGIANYVLFCDDELGQQNICAAGEREQAALLFRHVKGMIENEPELDKRCKIFKATGMRSIEAERGYFKVLSSDADTKHGGNLHLAIIDELHVQKTRDLVDVIQTSMASANRRQPLFINVTTADFGRPSICNEKHDYASKVRDGVIVDPYFLPVIYEASREDDWTSPAVWRKANPNFGVSVSEEYFIRECKRAQDTPSYENTFKRLHLNIVTEQADRWLSLDMWDSCAGGADEQALAGRQCFAGLDLASTRDVAALVLDFPRGDGTHDVICRFWVPRANAIAREKKDRVPYTTWARQGLVKLTDGDVIDYDVIRTDIVALGKVFNIREIAVDRWSAQQITTQLGGDGFEMVPFGQGYSSMSAPTKELEKILVGRQARHGGNAVLRWMAGNVVVESDAAGNIKPSKKHSTEKIDGIVAWIMALGRAIVSEGDGASVYEARGLRGI